MTYPGCGINSLLAILFGSILLVGTGCQRATSLETPDTGIEDRTGSGSGAAPASASISGTSKFILVPSGPHCSDAVVHGSYTVKSPLTLNDFVVLTVEVISPGTWAYTTSTIKGFKFGNSGNFTSTGQQQIILIASGTPNSSGVAEFLLSVGTAACSVKVEIKPPGAVGLGPQGEFYYKATIGGADYFEVVTDPGNFEAGSGLNGADEVSINAAIYHTADPMPLGVTAFGVTKGMMSGYSGSTDARFKAFFAPGTYSYTYNGNKNGVEIGWRDMQGRSWRSTHDTIRQPATSTFQIISVEDSYDAIGNYYIKVKMQFNCILFRDNSNERVELKNGEFVGLFRKG